LPNEEEMLLQLFLQVDKEKDQEEKDLKVSQNKLLRHQPLHLKKKRGKVSQKKKTQKIYHHLHLDHGEMNPDLNLNQKEIYHLSLLKMSGVQLLQELLNL
jgi:hypothetical protein